MNLVCEICNQEIAKIGYIKSPIQGSMFEGVAPHLPNPFQPMQMWDHMKCPHCNYRPFFKKDTVLTNLGPMIFDNNGPVDIGFLYKIDRKLVEKEFDRYESELPGNRQHEPQPPNYPPHTSDDSAPDPVPEIGNSNFESVVPAPEPSKPGPVDIPEPSDEAEGNEADPAPVEVGTAVEQFEALIGDEILQSGSWFGYKGANYRKTELMEKLINEKKILV